VILIFGENGYVSKRFQSFFDYKKVQYKAVSLKECDVLHKVGQSIIKHKPTFIINAIGYTGKPNVDACEDNKEECLIVNVQIANNIANACRHYDIPFGHVSSGCIYNSINENKVYDENDEPNFSFPNNNCSYYSGCKALAEKNIQSVWEKSYLWRLRMPFNHLPSSKNFISKILEYNKVISLPNSLTNIDEFVQACYYSIIKNVPYGTYNIVNPDAITAKEILEICKEYNLTKKEYNYFETLEEFTKIVKTPRSNCVLSSDKIMNEGFGLLSSKESVRKALSVWNQTNSTIFW